jgi:hypothetical protein
LVECDARYFGLQGPEKSATRCRTETASSSQITLFNWAWKYKLHRNTATLALRMLWAGTKLLGRPS